MPTDPPHAMVHPVPVAHACPTCHATYTPSVHLGGLIVAWRNGHRVHDIDGWWWCCDKPFRWEPER